MSDDKALLRVGLHIASGLEDIPDGLLRELLDSCYRARRKKPACLDLLVTTDAEMARMNRRHLGRDNPTDVLAFDDGEMEDGRVRLGDVAISADTAKSEAERRGISFQHELAFYALHGLLHLLGMNDDTDEERSLMHKAQVKAMQEYGIRVGDDALQIWRKGDADA